MKSKDINDNQDKNKENYNSFIYYLLINSKRI